MAPPCCGARGSPAAPAAAGPGADPESGAAAAPAAAAAAAGAAPAAAAGAHKAARCRRMVRLAAELLLLLGLLLLTLHITVLRGAAPPARANRTRAQRQVS